jgi:hypothetical protein
MIWRTGRKVGRTIYIQRLSEQPTDEDHLIGVMDTPELAALVVASVNEALNRLEQSDEDR